MKSAAVILSAFLICQHISPLLCTTQRPATTGARASCQTFSVPPDDIKLRALRAEMRRRTSVLGAELDAYIIPTYDEHQSETPSNRDRRLLYLSGFSGSDGVAVVTMSNAALWTDGRYHLQADKELSCHWLLMRQEDDDTPTLSEWINSKLTRGARVGADPRLVPHRMWNQWENGLSLMGIYLVQVPNNLVDILWEKDERPPPSRVPIYVHHKEFAGKLWQTKVAELRKELKDQEIDAMIVTALDELAWLLNIRGKDLPYSPVAKSYLILTQEQLYLYAEPKKLSIEAKLSLRADVCFNPNCTKLHAYDSIWSDLRTLSQVWNTVLLPAFYSFSPGVSEAIYTSVPEEKRVYKASPIINMKAKKNPTEIAGMRRAHIRDGAAMCDVLSYIEDRLQTDDGWDELKVVKVLDVTRKSQENNKGLSFATIAGYGPHGALPHYQPTNATSSLILKDSTFVLDSGGQYDDGTTDISRTLHYGTPTLEQRKAYTHVLMAAIDLSLMVFPADLKMNDIDIVARKELWKQRKDYMHSTGHGIGSFLQAHEAPIQIAYGQRQIASFKPGYFFSNEPGFYEEGKFGVRLENILEVEEYTEGKKSGDENTYLKFTDITLVPYEPKLIDVNMLSQYQRRWLNDYNIRVREIIGSELKRKTNMKAFHWMMNKTVLVPEYGLVGNANHTYISNMLLILMAIYLIAFQNYY